jgi:preprotein translocase subunit SecD
MAYLELNGAQLGSYDIVPIGDALSLGLDLRGGVYAVYEADSAGVEEFDTLLQGTITILQSRLDDQGFHEATVTRQGTQGIRVEIPNVSDPDDVLRIIGTPAVLEFKDPNGEVIMTGEDIKVARAGSNEGQYVVYFELSDAGATKFSNATARLVGQTISIELDGETISAPNVNEPITGGSGMITGNMDLDGANELAMLIQSGSLPLNIQQREVRTISATLGVDALEKSVQAGAIGLILVILFMIVMYRLPGLMSAIALLIYLLLTMFFLAALPGIQLTLPGIAGLILTIGMAVDANVIIFERFKEEMRDGLLLRTAVESGFRRAASAIIDSNVTTLIAGVVLLFFGTGTIRGFAITLTIGVLLSMFSAIVVTRALLRMMIRLGITDKRFYGVKARGGESA